jgi:hypothetical protein
VSVVCCQIEVSATPVQRSPTESVVCLSVIVNPRYEETLSHWGLCAMEEKEVNVSLYLVKHYATFESRGRYIYYFHSLSPSVPCWGVVSFRFRPLLCRQEYP